MPIEELDHVNLRTNDLSKMIDWYDKVLGLKSGDRPDFPFPGAWLYAGNTAYVHLVGVEGNSGSGSETDLKLEHFAFFATDRAEFEAKLNALGETFKTVHLRDAGIVQYNIWDPDGNHIHIDFSDAE